MLFVALIVLIVMSLAGLALMRQTGSATSIAGNVAFREAATSVADVGIEKARIYIKANSLGNALHNDDPTSGYFATWDTSFNPATKDWTTNVGTPIVETKTKNKVAYVIHRLCALTGAPGTAGSQQCAEAPIPTIGSKSGATYPTPDMQPNPQPFYRITSRVEGPRNTFSIIQVIVTF